MPSTPASNASAPPTTKPPLAVISGLPETVTSAPGSDGTDGRRVSRSSYTGYAAPMKIVRSPWAETRPAVDRNTRETRRMLLAVRRFTLVDLLAEHNSSCATVAEVSGGLIRDLDSFFDDRKVDCRRGADRLPFARLVPMSDTAAG